MSKCRRSDRLGRRQVLLGSGAVAVLATLAGAGPLRAAQAKEADANGWEAAVKVLTGGRKPVDGKIALDIADTVENGNTVPFTVAVESPMTDNAYVKAIHIVSTGNPLPTIGSFYFTPQAGKAAVASRMRLAQSQDVVGLAELSDGQFIMTKRNVKVNIGGCGG